MATFTVTVPDKIAIGRNAEHGTLDINWEKVPQHVRDHIAGTYFPQYITDRANSGGTDSTSAERLALANKKLDAMYAGLVRARGTAEPVDRTEAEAYRLARPTIIAKLEATPEWKQCPKGTKDRAQWVLDARDAAAKREPREVIDLVKQAVENNPIYREEARKNVKAADARKAKMAAIEINID
jgi:uncharacterized protein with WD repeat